MIFVFTLSVSVLIVFCIELEKFRANLCFDSSEYSVQTADGNNKVTSKIL